MNRISAATTMIGTEPSSSSAPAAAMPMEKAMGMPSARKKHKSSVRLRITSR